MTLKTPATAAPQGFAMGAWVRVQASFCCVIRRTIASMVPEHERTMLRVGKLRVRLDLDYVMDKMPAFKGEALADSARMVAVMP